MILHILSVAFILGFFLFLAVAAFLLNQGQHEDVRARQLAIADEVLAQQRLYAKPPADRQVERRWSA